MVNEVITLPEKEDMLRRLAEVNDNSHLQKSFYSLLAKQASGEKVAEDIALMFSLAIIYEYIKDMPPVMSKMMYMVAPKLIDAIIDNKDIAKKTKEIFNTSI